MRTHTVHNLWMWIHLLYDISMGTFPHKSICLRYDRHFFIFVGIRESQRSPSLKFTLTDIIINTNTEHHVNIISVHPIQLTFCK